MKSYDPALPKQIKATIHEDAIQRVSRFFDASFKETLNELFQNARRAGASKVDVTIEAGGVIITDDGLGIAHPGAILAFGLSDWDRDTTRREDPAGMGIYVLAKKTNITITSRHRDAAEAWRVQLGPGHFTGEMAAPVEVLRGDQVLPGTCVSFDERNPTQSDVQEAARYCPLPVTLNGEELERRDYLQEAVYREDWRGLRIGVRKGNWPSHGYDNVNFHGITLYARALPWIACMESSWHAFIDVVDCPGLELTLPARKELVQTPFLDEMVQACRAVIYRAMLENPSPVDLPREQYEQAHALGVNMPEARAFLAHWEPEKANSWAGFHTEEPRGPIAGEVLLADTELEIPDQQALFRALQRNRLEDRVWKVEHGMAGYGWYDRLERITDVTVRVEKADGTIINLKEARASQEMPFDEMAHAITIILTLTSQNQEQWTLKLASDLVFFDTDLGWFEDNNNPIVTKDNGLDVDELTKLLMDSFFSPSDDGESDSYQTQQEEHEEHFVRMARSLLVNKENAVLKAVQSAVGRHVRYELPRGWTASIQIDSDGAVEVSLTPTQ